MAAVLSLSAVVAHAAPVGGEVVSGAGSVSQSGATTTVTQSSPNLSLTWKSFNIAPQETVNFAQPSAAAIAVNRIFDTNGTQILGRLNANGQVYLINPNGILFGQGAQVNVGGLVASTLDLNDSGFNSNARSFSGGGSGRVVNQGTISAVSGGYVALLGNQVSNQGTITAHLGAVALGAGSAATLTFSGNSLVRMQVDQSVLNSVADNGGLIRADGGIVVMSAGARDSLLASVVNNTGVVEARTVEHRDGTIILLGGMATGSVNVGGSLDASAPNGGNGGNIETSAAHVKVARDARVTTAAPVGLAGNWLIDPVDFTIAAAGGDISGTTLSTNLGSGNIVIQSTNGAVGTTGDVNVNDAVAWSANKLTLNAQKNININANLNGSGTASLALEYGQGAIAAGNTSDVVVRAEVNLSAGPNFSTKAGSDGLVKNYIVITSLGLAGSITGADLQGMNGSLASNYALGANIDAAPTSAWNGGAGFVPIGSLTTGFTGTFDGLGHSVSGLAINLATPDVGLFGYTGIGAAVRNVGLVGGSVVGGAGTGALVGNNGADNLVTNSYATTSVSGGAGTGGLVGSNTTGTISGSHATGNVTGAAGSGGLVGSNTSGTISGSYATGNVTGAASSGGLVGSNTSGAINACFATGNVNGAAGTGGLIGTNTSGPVSNSYATGDVMSSGAGTGGLIGSSTSGLITNTYSTGNVSSPGAGVGGLVGSGTAAAVINSYWDTVTSGQSLSPGGGAGRNTTQMKEQGNFNAWDFASTWTIYEGVTSPLLLSLMTPLTVTANDDNTTYSGVAYSGGNGVTYSAPLNGIAPAGTLSYTGSAQGQTNAGSYVITPTGLQSNQQYLITYADGTLTIGKAILTVTADDKSRLYGQANPVLTTTLSGFVNGETIGTAAGLTGTGAASTTATATTNAGNAVITAGAGTLSATNYDFTTLVDGTLSIGKAVLTVTADDKSRLYGQANPALTTTLSGFVNGETSGTAAGLTGTGAATTTATATTNAGTAVITAGAGTLAATNYDFTTLVDGTLSIGKAVLTVTADDKSRLYGQANPVLTTTLSGFVNGETIGTAAGLTGTGAASTTATATTNAGNAVITAGAGTLSATNYDFTTLVDGTLSIGKANLTAAASATDKTYDANTSASITLGPLNGLVGSETLGFTASGTFDNKNVETGKNVSVVYTLANGGNGGLASNYSLANASLVADISAASLAVTGVTVSNKVYDGNTAALLGGSAAVNALGADVVAVDGSGSGVFNSATIGTGKPVAVSGFTLSGADAGNYIAVQPAGLTADITSPLTAVANPPVTPPPAPSRPLLDAVAQLESDVLRFVVCSPPEAPSLSSSVASARSFDSDTVEDVRSAICTSGVGAPQLQFLDGGMRLPADGLKVD